MHKRCKFFLFVTSYWFSFAEFTATILLKHMWFTGHEIRPEDIGLVTVKGDDEMQPFMVAFLKATNHVKPRQTRDTHYRRVKKSEYTNVMKSTYGQGKIE